MKKRMFKITALILSAVLLVTGTFYFTLAYLQAKSNPVVNTFTAGKINLTLKESEVDEYGNVKYYADDAFITGSPNESAVEGTDYKLVNSDTYTKVNLVEKNNYKLVPGETYTKNPVVTVAANSEPCFLYLAVYNGLNDSQIMDVSDYSPVKIEDDSNTIHSQLLANGWQILTASDGLAGVSWNGAPKRSDFTVYYYHSSTSNSYIVNTSNDPQTFGTFNSFKIDESASNGQILSLETMYDASGEPTADFLAYAAIIEVYAFAVQSTGFTNISTGDIDAVRNAWNATFGASGGTTNAVVEE
ncbi:MAG: hypothetical protein IJB76_00395 [Clostridia bacterium]|nr:hypothetical protein [Clostridia bacterium]